VRVGAPVRRTDAGECPGAMTRARPAPTKNKGPGPVGSQHSSRSREKAAARTHRSSSETGAHLQCVWETVSVRRRASRNACEHTQRAGTCRRRSAGRKIETRQRSDRGGLLEHVLELGAQLADLRRKRLALALLVGELLLPQAARAVRARQPRRRGRGAAGRGAAGRGAAGRGAAGRGAAGRGAAGRGRGAAGRDVANRPRAAPSPNTPARGCAATCALAQAAGSCRALEPAAACPLSGSLP
jgi:hypothetical protein